MHDTQLTAEQVRDLLHEVAGMLGIEVEVIRTDLVWFTLGLSQQNIRMPQRDIDAINEGRVVDAMRARGWVHCVVAHPDKFAAGFDRQIYGLQYEPAGQGHEEHRLVAVLLAARAALKAEEADRG